MYIHEDQVPVLGGFGAAQTGTIPAGSTVIVPKGTTVLIYDPASRALPTSRVLSNRTSLVLVGPAAVTGDVEGRDLVSLGAEATLAYNTAMEAPARIEGVATKPGEVVDVPGGTKVVFQRRPDPRSQDDCPAGWTFVPAGMHGGDVGLPAMCNPPRTCHATAIQNPDGTCTCAPGSIMQADGSCLPTGGEVVATSKAVPWYKRGSTYVVAGGILLLGVIVVAAVRKG